MLTLNDEERRLAARAAELSARAAAGEITATSYLTPREQLVLAERFAGDPGCFSADGGYAAAERKRFFFLPEDVRDTEEPYRTELLADIRAEKLTAVKITGSGYRALAHRDYLGAVLNLGVKRESLGDLCVPDAFSAVLSQCAGRKIADKRGHRQQSAPPQSRWSAAPEVKHQTGRQKHPDSFLGQQTADADGDGQKGQKGQRLHIHFRPD